MRVVVALAALVWPVLAQFKSTVPLVVAPTTVTDRDGRFIDGLTERDLVVYDNNVPQTIQVDSLINPISLVVLVQASSNSAANLDKLGGAAILFTELLSAEAGETALLSFSDSVRAVEDFTSDPKRLSRAMKSLRVRGNGASLLDAVHEALDLLAARGTGRRHVIFVIGERRDRTSALKLPALVRDPRLQNTTIYWLTYSTFLAPFTSRPKTVWDTMSDEEKARPERLQGQHKYPLPEEEEVLPPEMPPGSLLSLFTELKQRGKADAAELLSRTTGGRVFSFLKRSGLESAIQAVAEEVHRQYIVSFQPKADTPGLFHALRIEVKDRPDLQVRARVGYWGL